MIYYTNFDKERDFADLYREWVGHTPEFKGIQTNSYWVGAKDTETNKWIGAAQLIVVDDPIYDRRWGLVENVYVAKDYRRRGVGTQLMREVEAMAFTFGCEFIKLTSRKEEGKALYRSLGYGEGSSFRKELSSEAVFSKFVQEDFCRSAGL